MANHLMHRVFRTALLSVLIGVMGATLLAAGDDSNEFKSSAARTASKDYLARLAKIQSEADAKAATARKEYIAALMNAEKVATRSGDLDEGVHIRDRVAELQKIDSGTSWQARSAVASKVSGTTWTTNVGSLHFNADGTINPLPDGTSGRWAAMGSRQVLILYSSNVCDLFEFNESFENYRGTHARFTNDSWQGRRSQ